MSAVEGGRICTDFLTETNVNCNTILDREDFLLQISRQYIKRMHVSS